MNSQNDRAHIVESIETYPFKVNTSYTGRFDISNFARAVALAGNFKQYRACKVEYIWEPQYTNYQAAAGNADVPFLYYMMNRTGEEGADTVDMLRRQGAKPIKFSKTIFKTFKPNTLMGTLAGKQIIEQEAPPTQIVTARANWTFSPTYDIWQSTEILKPSNGLLIASPPTFYDNQIGLGPAQYYGLDFLVDQDTVITEEPYIGKLTIRVYWEFKEPRSLNDVNTAKVVNATSAFQSLTPPS